MLAEQLDACADFDAEILPYFAELMDNTSAYVSKLKQNRQRIGRYQSGVKPEFRTRSNQA